MGRSTARRARRSPRKRSRSSSRWQGAGDSLTNVPSLTSHTIRPRGRFWAERQARIFFYLHPLSIFFKINFHCSNSSLFPLHLLLTRLGSATSPFSVPLQNVNLYQKPNWIFFLPVLSKVINLVKKLKMYLIDVRKISNITCVIRTLDRTK